MRCDWSQNKCAKFPRDACTFVKNGPSYAPFGYQPALQQIFHNWFSHVVEPLMIRLTKETAKLK